MVNRPRPERFIEAGRVLVTITGGRIQLGADTAREAIVDAVHAAPGALAGATTFVVDRSGRLIRRGGHRLRRAAGRVEHVVEH